MQPDRRSASLSLGFLWPAMAIKTGQCVSSHTQLLPGPWAHHWRRKLKKSPTCARRSRPKVFLRKERPPNDLWSPFSGDMDEFFSEGLNAGVGEQRNSYGTRSITVPLLPKPPLLRIN